MNQFYLFAMQALNNEEDTFLICYYHNILYTKYEEWVDMVIAIFTYAFFLKQ